MEKTSTPATEARGDYQRLAAESMAPVSNSLGVAEKKDRGKGGAKKRSSKSRKWAADNRNLVVTNDGLASLIKWSFNFFFVFEIIAYACLVYVFSILDGSFSDLCWGIVLTCPLVIGTLVALPIMRDYCIQGYAMAQAASKRRKHVNHEEMRGQVLL